MRILLSCILLFNILSSPGQSCQSINGKKLNCTDSLGRKQGEWILRKVIETGRDTVWHTIAKGYFKNDKKIGTWQYYNDNDHQIYLDKEIIYYENGDLAQNDIYDRCIVKCNKDTSEIMGTVIRNDNKVLMECKGKKCVFSFNHKSVVAFDFTGFSSFDMQRVKLILGMYDRKIEEIKQR